jgi:dihydrodipicolinate synthase/N-acetylneuraminate lyase
MELSANLFPLVRLAATTAVLAALEASGEEPSSFFERHAAGEWGEVPESQRAVNTLSLITGEPLWSSFKTALGVEFWVVTGTDRSITYLLLPEECEEVETVRAERRTWV